MEFDYYYGKHRRKNKVWTQQKVDTKSDLLKVRIEPTLKKKIESRANDVGKSAAELTRILWKNYFEKLEQKLWAEEVKEW